MKKLTGLILAGGMLLMSSHAATINWTTSAITGLESDVVTNGVTLEAINGAHAAETAAPAINGVTFTSDGSLLSGNWDGDPWDPAATNDYDTLLSTVDYQSSGLDPVTIKTFQGLTVDAEYLIQVWHADSAAANKSRTMTYDGTGLNVLDGESYAVGTFTANATTQTLVVTSSHNGPRLNAYQLRAISGHVADDPIIDVSVSNLNFGVTYIGYTNSLTVTLENVGGPGLVGTASVSAPFYIESGGTYSLAAGQQQVVTVLFVPTTETEFNDTLSFTGGGGTNITVSGTGVVAPDPSIGLSADSLDFGVTYLDQTNSLTVTVQNAGAGTLDGTASVAAPFYVESGGTYSLGAGEEQDVVILFAPLTEDDFSETLSFTGAGGTNISVIGTGAVQPANAVISWTGYESTGSSNEVVTTGSTVEAVNATGGAAGGISTGTLTANGVTFTNRTDLLPNNGGNYFTTLTSTDPGYNQLMESIDYGANSDTALTITFTGLEVGKDYLIQYWYLENSVQTRTMTLTASGRSETGVDDVVLSPVGSGDQYAVGTFTALSEAQDFTIIASANGVRVTAYQLRQLTFGVTEPVVLSIGTDATGSNMLVNWNSEANLSYTVQSRDNLSYGDWSTVSSSIMATPPMNTYTGQISETTGFYQVIVE